MTLFGIDSCPGRFCGCQISSTYNATEGPLQVPCGKCPWGSRVNKEYSICERCNLEPQAYDWLYLTSIMILLFLGHMIIVDWTLRNKFKSPKPPVSQKLSQSAKNRKTEKDKFSFKFRCATFLIISIVVEVSLSAILTLLLTEPYGKMSFITCGSRGLADWYPIFFNPRIDYTTTLYCTQEIVYPLYSLVLTFFCSDLVLMLIIRPAVSYKLNCGAAMSTYIALYFIPSITFVYSFTAGLYYYSFPYLFLLISLVSIAFNLCLEYSRCSKSLMTLLAPPPPRIVALIVIHWGLHSFTILSITLSDIVRFWWLLLLVPMPVLFFIITIRFTDPNQVLHRRVSRQWQWPPFRPQPSEPPLPPTIRGTFSGSQRGVPSRHYAYRGAPSSRGRNRLPGGLPPLPPMPPRGGRNRFASTTASMTTNTSQTTSANSSNDGNVGRGSSLSVVFEQQMSTPSLSSGLSIRDL